MSSHFCESKQEKRFEKQLLQKFKFCILCFLLFNLTYSSFYQIAKMFTSVVFAVLGAVLTEEAGKCGVTVIVVAAGALMEDIDG